MTRLLVSVRDAAEARIALECGVDLLDVKEPRLGSLGAAEPGVWREIADVARELSSDIPLSAACGELRDWIDRPRSSASIDDKSRTTEVQEIPAGFSYFKIGLSGMGSPRFARIWFEEWARLVAAWRRPQGHPLGSLRPVAAAYADQAGAQSPSPADILHAGRELGCHFALIDTFNKSAGGLLEHWTPDDLQCFVELAHSLKMQAVAAGSLTLAEIPIVVAAGVDWVAVRGAACETRRTGPVSPRKIAELRQAIVRSTCDQEQKV